MSVSVVSSRTALEELLKETPNACVHFAADWCEPSKALHNAMNTWEYPKVRLVTAMAEEMADVCEELGVETVPYIVFYKDGKKVDAVAGAKIDVLKEKIEGLYNDVEVIDIEKRMKNLINREKVMLFMKGEPSAPRCGFSRTIVSILNEEGIKFGHFDILTDEAIRQGLKTYSNWPTYPQLYVNGELLGGLDVVKELKEDGELAASLQ
eukprot:TRINITY_DN18168_c2_g1_i1.p2 TRINITY_DN18168_c2_g1~~TRINITY_DN18168_c2_g1_i1.p2  ORF type:complete len:208 (+),score=80.99 TRINITY_DN18168_c2_g1_i1:42-665(+)